MQARHRFVDRSKDEDEGEGELITERSALYAFIMAGSEDDRAPFAPFLTHLRLGAVSTPHTWSREDVERLPKDMLQELRTFEAHIVGQYQALFPDLCEASPELFPATLCTEDAWRRAHNLYSSYAFAVDNAEDQDADGWLLPLLDCMNHDSEAANVEWRGLGLEPEHGAVVTRPVLMGEELLYSYGCKSNVQLIMSYGFAVWDNPHESVTLDFVLKSEPGDSWEQGASRLAEAALGASGLEHSGAGCATFRLRLEDVDEALPPALLKMAAACAGSTSESKRLLRSMLLKAGKALMVKGTAGRTSRLSGPAWEKYEKGLRRQAVKVGCQRCAVEPEACAVALRSSQIQVLLAALELLESDPEAI